MSGEGHLSPGAAQSNTSPRPIATAPRDGEMLWLLVDYGDSTGRDGEGAHPLADAGTAWTIGFNNHDNDGEDVWKFAGWCWCRDHFAEGRGKVIGWMPIGFELGADDLDIAHLVQPQSPPGQDAGWPMFTGPNPRPMTLQEVVNMERNG